MGWNLLTNEVFIGEGFEELFGYVIKDNKGDMIADWSNTFIRLIKKLLKKNYTMRLFHPQHNGSMPTVSRGPTVPLLKLM
jgi:hypothetical protein